MNQIQELFVKSFDNPSFPWGIMTSLFVLATAYVLARAAARIAQWCVSRAHTRHFADATVAHSRRKRTETQGMLISTSIRFIIWVIAAWLCFALIVPSSNASLVGASLGLALAGFAAQPMIHDMITGWHMMTSRWYEVGDAVTLEPHGWAGVVEDISLRSTTLRSISGERIMVHHRHVQAARVARQSVRSIQIEMWVSDAERARTLVDQVSHMLPHGPVELVRPLSVIGSERVGENLELVRAEAAVPPGREWLLDDLALALLREHDAKDQIIKHGPISRFVDDVAERRFSRAVEPVLAVH